MFGGGIADWTFGADEAARATVIGGALITLWDAESGGSQLTDLQNLNGAAIATVTTSTGADGKALGQIPMFYGPDGYFELWASANDGPRALMTAVNLGSFLGPIRDQFNAHVAPSNRNPHQTRIVDAADVDPSLAAGGAGTIPVKNDAGLWIAGSQTVGGGGGDVTTNTDQTISGQKTWNTGDAAKSTNVFQAAATGQTADLWSAWSGTDTGQGGARQRTTYLNEKGELRAIAAKTNSVAVRFKGQPGQTANILEITDTSNVAKAWFGPNYGVYAPNAGRSLNWTKAGDIALATGAFAWTNDLEIPMAIRSVRASLGTPYASGTLTVDVRVGGTTIYATPGNRPSIAAAASTSGKNTGFSTSVIGVGSTVTVDIVAIGAGNVGKDLYVQIEIW
jgi:hypothetical protein